MRFLLSAISVTLFAIPTFAQVNRATVMTEAPIMLLPDATRVPLRVAAVGTSLVVLDTRGDWLRVEFNDPQLGIRTGFVQAKFVRVQAAPPALAPVDLSVPQRPQTTTTPPATPRLTPAIGTAAAPGAAISFRNVDYSQVDGERERTRDARLVLDPSGRTITFADEDRGEAREVYARIPYDAITKIVYEQSAHRRYGAGVVVSPLLFFTKAKKHWLTIEFQNVGALPQGFVYAQLDKDNYRPILSALRAGTGRTIEEHIEE